MLCVLRHLIAVLLFWTFRGIICECFHVGIALSKCSVTLSITLMFLPRSGSTILQNINLNAKILFLFYYTSYPNIHWKVAEYFIVMWLPGERIGDDEERRVKIRVDGWKDEMEREP